MSSLDVTTEADLPSTADDFSRHAEQSQIGFLQEFRDFLLQNKKWWITPIAVVLLLLGILVMLAGTPLSPLIYTMF